MSSIRRWGLSALLLCLPAVALSIRPVRAADEAPGATETKAEDALIHSTLRAVINEGADMYNATGRYKNMDRDFAGCYHLYEGALMVARPLLSRHADLQKAIDDGIATARETPQMEQRAFVLRAVIDKIREEVNPKSTTVVSPTTPTNQHPTINEPLPVKETTTKGKIINGEKGKLIVLVDGKSKTFTIPDTAKVLINGKEGKLEELDFTRAADVTITSKGDLVTKVDAHVEAKTTVEPKPPVPPLPAVEKTHPGKVVAANADSITIKSNDKDAKYSVPPTAKISIDGKAGKLADVKEGNEVTVTTKGDVVTKVEVVLPASPPHPVEPGPGNETKKSLWDRLGGEANVAKVVDDFVNTAGRDPKVNFWRDPTKVPSKEEVADLKTKLVEFVSSATGGPLKYEGKSMKEVHKGMKITNEEFDAAAKDLKDALEKNHAKSEDVDAVMKAVGGTRKDIVEVKDSEEKAKPEEEKKPEEKTNEKGNVSGKVSINGKPVTGGVVKLVNADGKAFQSDLNADGHYEIKDLKPGAYTVAVDTESLNDPAKPNPAYVAIPAKYRSAKTSGLTFDIKEGKQNLDVALVEPAKPGK